MDIAYKRGTGKHGAGEAKCRYKCRYTLAVRTIDTKEIKQQNL